MYQTLKLTRLITTDGKKVTRLNVFSHPSMSQHSDHSSLIVLKKSTQDKEISVKKTLVQITHHYRKLLPLITSYYAILFISIIV